MHFSRTRLLLILALLVVCGGGFFWGASYLQPSARRDRFLRSAEDYARQGKTNEAIIQYLNAINVDPRLAKAHYELGKLALKSGDTDSAYFEMIQVTELDPGNLDAQIQVGNLLLGRGSVIEARKRAELVLASDGQNYEAHVLLAQAYGALDRLDDAIAETQKAQQIDAKRPDALIVRAGLQAQGDKLAEAEATYREALAMSPSDLDAQLGLASLYQKQQRIADAENVLQEAIKGNPKDPVPRVALMYLYVVQRQLDKAQQVATQAKTDLPNTPLAYRMLADYFVMVEDRDRALAEFTAIYKAHPHDSQARKDYAQLLITNGRLVEASKVVDDLLADQGTDADALLEHAQIALRQGTPQQALKDTQTALRIAPNNYLAHFYAGSAMAGVGDAEGAEREWREAVRLQPRARQAQEALSNLAAARGDMQLLQRTAQNVLQNEPYAATGFLMRATAEYANGQPARAEEDWKRAMAIEPNNPLPYTKLGQYRITERRFPEGEQLLEQALQKDATHAPALETLVALYAANNNLNKAIDRVQAQIAKAPNFSPYYSILANLRYRQKDWTATQAAASKALQLDDTNSAAWELLGRAQGAGGNVDQTIDTFRKWIAAVPSNPKGYDLLAGILEQRGDWRSAQDLYRKALSYDSNDAFAANNLAYSLLEHGGNLDEAVSYALLARKNTPGAPTPVDTLGWAYYRKGEYKLAVDVLQDAAAKMPNNIAVNYHLGLAL